MPDPVICTQGQFYLFFSSPGAFDSSFLPEWPAWVDPRPTPCWAVVAEQGPCLMARLSGTSPSSLVAAVGPAHACHPVGRATPSVVLSRTFPRLLFPSFCLPWV